MGFKMGFKMGKKYGKFKFFSKNLDKNLYYPEKAWLSRFISIVSISLNDLDKNLDTAKSRLKSLDFKNLDREKKNSGLDTKDVLDLDWSRLSRPPTLILHCFVEHSINKLRFLGTWRSTWTFRSTRPTCRSRSCSSTTSRCTTQTATTSSTDANLSSHSFTGTVRKRNIRW